jgi:hypothetical protein
MRLHGGDRERPFTVVSACVVSALGTKPCAARAVPNCQDRQRKTQSSATFRLAGAKPWVFELFDLTVLNLRRQGFSLAARAARPVDAMVARESITARLGRTLRIAHVGSVLPRFARFASCSQFTPLV